MNTSLTSAQIKNYRDNGFILQKGFLSTKELKSWRNTIDTALVARGEKKIAAAPGNHAMKDADDEHYYSRVFIQRINLWQDNPEVKKLILNPEIGRMCCELEGIKGIRVWHDQALIKGPWANPTAWHLDNPKWSFHSKHSISIWVALDDVTMKNGCLFFIPGSHKNATFENVSLGHHMGGLFDFFPQWSGREPFVAEMKAGDCSFHNGLTAHSAHANMTPGYRRAMTCAFMPVGSRYNGLKNILSQEQMSKFVIGQELDDDEQNPVVWES